MAVLTVLLIAAGMSPSCAQRQATPATEPPAEVKASLETPAKVPVSPSPRTFAEAANRFGFELWPTMEIEGNAVISPASVYIALNMTSAGATGETAAEMVRVLHQADDAGTHHRSAQAQLERWGTPTEASSVLAVANRLFADDSISPSPTFQGLTEERYGAPMETLSFSSAPESSRGAINRWIAEVTREKIPELLAPGSLSTETRMVLTNAIYFKGQWRDPFKAERTT
ncbi:MAG: serpin family protein, partial [Myxococcota bacterium]|nr:serpin family protein [Myxococcota bacterium]